MEIFLYHSPCILLGANFKLVSAKNERIVHQMKSTKLIGLCVNNNQKLS